MSMHPSIWQTTWRAHLMRGCAEDHRYVPSSAPAVVAFADVVRQPRPAGEPPRPCVYGRGRDVNYVLVSVVRAFPPAVALSPLLTRTDRCGWAGGALRKPGKAGRPGSIKTSGKLHRVLLTAYCWASERGLLPRFPLMLRGWTCAHAFTIPSRLCHACR